MNSWLPPREVMSTSPKNPLQDRVAVAERPTANKAAREARETSPPKPAKRRRIAIACSPCRYRKSRCDGNRPQCSTCEGYGYDCIYPQSVQLSSTASRVPLLPVEERLATIESLLQGVARRLDRIECNQGDSLPRESHVPTGQGSHYFADGDSEYTTIDPQEATDGIGSMIFSHSQDPGYFGPSSNIAFTRYIVQATTAALKRTQPHSPQLSLDALIAHSHMLLVSRPPSPIRQSWGTTKVTGPVPSLFSLPPPDQTLRLIGDYFGNTWLLFPYIDRDAFLASYHEFVSNNALKVRRSWLGLLNMVLAMATNTSYGSHPTAQLRAGNSDVFFSRAMALCEIQMKSEPSLEIVQFLLLVSQYLQGTNRSSQTWNMHGLALKSAYQLGLHSRDALCQYSPLEREIRIRTWYGCVILDRSLSMTLGRPCSIPESYVKLDMPRCLSSTVDSTNFTSNQFRSVSEFDSLAFYNATIGLYKIMWRVLDALYGGNLGCDAPQNIFDITSHVIRVEQQLLEWVNSLPLSMRLVQADELVDISQGSREISRYRVILTLRYLNLRVLAHRPVLHKFLDAVANYDAQALSAKTLQQVGSSSLGTCIQSAIGIVELMARIVHSEDSKRPLGAWWFSLHYTFNAALALYSDLLIRQNAVSLGMTFVDTDIDARRAKLQQTIETLLLLDKGNGMTEKCAKYISKLIRIFNLICCDTSHQPADSVPRLLMNNMGPTNTQAAESLDPLSESKTPLEFMDVNEFMDLSDLQFLNLPICNELGP